jgi:hypothetical protein
VAPCPASSSHLQRIFYREVEKVKKGKNSLPIFLILICIVPCSFVCYLENMTIEQTVEIPADRRLHLDFDLPMTASVGTAKVILEFPTAETADVEAEAAELAAAEAEAAKYTAAGEGIPIPLRGKISHARMRRNERLLKPGDDPLFALSGVGAGLDTDEEKLEWKLRDKAIEEAHEKWLHGPK